jgi:hypothetical protein
MWVCRKTEGVGCINGEITATAWNTIPDKMIIVQSVRKFPIFYATQKFSICTFTKASHSFLS